MTVFKHISVVCENIPGFSKNEKCFGRKPPYIRQFSNNLPLLDCYLKKYARNLPFAEISVEMCPIRWRQHKINSTKAKHVSSAYVLEECFARNETLHTRHIFSIFGVTFSQKDIVICHSTNSCTQNKLCVVASLYNNLNQGKICIIIVYVIFKKNVGLKIRGES